MTPAGRTSSVVILVLVASGFAMQWWRSNDVLQELDARISELSVALKKAAEFKRHGDLMERDLATVEQRIADLRTRLPVVPNAEDFAAALIAGVRDHGVSLTLEQAVPIERDFYAETTLTFDVARPELSPMDLEAVIASIGRIADWEVEPDEHRLVVRIYSVPWQAPKKAPIWCDRLPASWGFHWPFTRNLRAKQSEVDRLCADRRRENLVLDQIAHWKARRQLMVFLAEIAEALAPGTAADLPGLPYPMR